MTPPDDVVPTQPHIHLPDGSCCTPKRFAHLHQHTQYSLLDGAAKLKDLLKWAKEVTPEGCQPALAMTDHGNMHGAVHFYNYAVGMGVKPIIGYEAYVVPGQGTRRDRTRGQDGEKGIFHLTLLARDFEGYQNLCRLSSRGYTEGYYYKPRIDHELLQEHHKGVIAFSGCLGSEVQQLLMQGREDEAKQRLLWYRDLFGENYFIEIQNHGLKEQAANNPILRAWAQELGIGMVATNDGHYVKKSDAAAHDTLLAIQTKAMLADENRFKFSCDEFYVKDLEEMQKALPVADWGEEVFDNTSHIADLCNVDLPVGKKRVYQMPALPIPEGRTMAEELRVQTYAGAVKRYPAYLTEGLLRDYAARSLTELGAEDAARVLARTNGCDAATCDLDTLYTLLAFLGSEWEERGKAAGEKYTPYPALEKMETASDLPAYAEADAQAAAAEDTVAHHQHALVILRRAEYELSVINNMGFPDYFLIVADYINWAKDHGISVGPGRGCLAPEVPIRMADGTTKPIADVERGEFVLTRDGSPRKVLNTYAYDCNEELLKITCYNGDRLGVTLTNDHEILAEKLVRVPEYDSWAASTKRARRSIKEPKGNLEWFRARDLAPGDWLFVPTPQVQEIQPADLDLTKFLDASTGIELSEDGETVNEYTLNKLAGTRKLRASLPRRIPFDAAFAKFLGLFAGDGWLRDQKSGRNREASFGLAFHADEQESLAEVEALLIKLGVQSSRQPHAKSKLIQLEVRSRVLRMVMRELFCDYQFTAQSKHVPACIMTAPRHLVESFIEGLIESDGHIAANKTRIVTTSHTMAEQVRTLLLRLGIPSSLGREHRFDERPEFAGRHENFTVDFAPSQRFAGVAAANIWTHHKIKGGTLLKLKSIEVVPSTGKVYDLKVEGNHNYLTSSFVVHNSGAGSIVAYAIRITNLDPLEFELLFERFLNPDRISMPDFDIDFNDARRIEVIQYVQDKYGEDKVAQIATFGTMASKACLKDVARVMGLEYAKVDKVSKLIPIKFGKSYTLEQARDAVPDIAQFLNEDPELLKAYEFAQKLEGLTRHASVHAAGVVIGKTQLTDLVPVMRDTSGAGMVCQYDMKAVEDIGLIKMDFLGLRTLSFLDEAKRILKESRQIDIDFDAMLITRPNEAQEPIPYDDKITYDLMSRGDTKGVFQLEGAGIADASRRLKPRRLADIIALSALYRPGPMENIPTYVRRHHGLEEVDYVRDGFPNSAQWLEKILKETYGIPVYQEQIMQIASEVAGYSLGGADLLRRCLAEGTLILDADTGKRIPIEQVKEGMNVLSLGPDYAFYKVPVRECIDNGVQEVFRLRTRSGRQIEVTKDHPLLTIEGWRHLSDLKLGDAIAVPIRENVSGQLEPDQHRSRVLALLVGDGNTFTNAGGGQVRARFYSKNEELLDAFTTSAQALGAVTARDLHPTTGVSTIRCVAPVGGVNPISALIREVGLDKLAHEKRLPLEVFTYTIPALQRFLGDLWSTDGSIEATRVSYASSSPALIDDISHLLLRLGIVSMRRQGATYRHTRYELVITDQDDVRRFYTELGTFLIREKCERLDKLLSLVNERQRNQSIYQLPVEVTHHVRAAKERSGRTWAEAGEAVGTPGSHLSAGLNFKAPNRALSRHRVALLATAFQSRELQQLAASDVLWDEIQSIEPAGSKQVYDLAVPPFANFLAADIIVHNSMGKKDAEEMKRQRGLFVDGAEKRGVPKDEGNRLFDLLDAFANYGFNKCLMGDTLVPIAGGELRRIEDLYRESQPIQLPSVNAAYELELRPTGQFFDNGVKPVFKVKTALGRELTATGNHPLLTLDGWRNVEDLQAGDRIAAPAKLPELGTEHWPEHQAALLGWILAEGNTCHTHGAYLYSKDAEQVADMVACAEAFANTKPTVKQRPERQNVYDIYLGSGVRGSSAGKSGVRLWLEELGLIGVGATAKGLPAAAFRLSNSDLAVLVGRYWSGDGFLFGKGNTTPYAATSSKRLAQDLVHVLLRLGMVAKLSEKHFTYERGEDTAGLTGYTVHLVGRRSIDRFLEVVAPHVVGRGDEIQALRAELDGPQEALALAFNPSAPSGHLPLKGRQDAVPVSPLRGDVPQGQRGHTARHSQSDSDDLTYSDHLYWDTITSIEAAGEAQTYDLEVPSTHNFVANDLIVHNSHSAAYGVITYQTAWLKANYPVEFMAALLTVERKDSDKVAEYVSDARKMDVHVLPPDINRSAADFAVQGEEILFGLYAIKGLGESAVQKILEERERGGRYKSLSDFCARLGSKVCNRKGMESLIKSGAFDQFGERKQLLESLEDAMEDAAGAADVNAKAQSGMSMMFGLEEVKQERPLRTGIAPYSDLERLKIEKDALGLYISGHPLEQHEGLREAASCRISDLDTWFTTQNVAPGKRIKAVLAGMIESVVKKPTKSGGMMARFILADESGQTELVAFSRAYDRIHEKLVNDTPALIIVELESEDGGLRAIAEEVVSVEQLADLPKVMYVTIDLETASPDALGEFQSVLDEHAGSMPTYLRLETPEQFVVYQLDHGMGSPEAIRVLNHTFPWANAHLAYDQQTILGRFAPKPPAWMNRQNGNGGGMRA